MFSGVLLRDGGWGFSPSTQAIFPELLLLTNLYSSYAPVICIHCGSTPAPHPPKRMVRDSVDNMLGNGILTLPLQCHVKAGLVLLLIHVYTQSVPSNFQTGQADLYGKWSSRVRPTNFYVEIYCKQVIIKTSRNTERKDHLKHAKLQRWFIP